MHLTEFKKILIIISTKSNNYKKIENKISKKFNDIFKNNINKRFEIILSKDKYSISNESKKFAENNNSNQSLLIIVGGDGSISEAVNQIYHTNINFSFLPNGTGNDFSKTVYGKLKFDEILDNIENIKIEKIDLLKINEKVSINVASFGYESIVLKKSLQIKENFPALGSLSFMLGVIFTLNKIQKYNFEYELIMDNGEIVQGEKEYMLTAICNGKYYGGGFNPAPYASITDGIADVNAVEYVSISKLLRVISLYKDHRHLSVKESRNYKVISGKYKRKDNSTFIGNIDGNIEEFKEVNFKILPKQLNLGIFKLFMV